MIGISADVSRVVKGMSKLAKKIDDIPTTTGLIRAHRCAAAIASVTPVYTGNLKATVHATPIRGGGAVHYGGNLPYTDRIEVTQHPVERGIKGSAEGFKKDMTDAATKEVSSL